jgi:hypothetical protein
MDEILTYYEPLIEIRHRVEGNSKFYLFPMKRCDPADFVARGYPMTDEFAESLKIRICPENIENE